MNTLAIRGAIVLGFLAASIQDDRASEPGTYVPPPAVALPLSRFPELRGAAENVTLGGVTLSLEAHLWRDFMPLSPPDGKPLVAVLFIKAADGSPIVTDVRADAAWVVYGDFVWACSEVERQNLGGERRRFAIRGGPKWGPGVTVDVIVRVRDDEGHVALVLSRGRFIERTS
jgi:hypothetical protein